MENETIELREDDGIRDPSRLNAAITRSGSFPVRIVIIARNERREMRGR